MPNNEQLAEYVKQMQSQLEEQEISKGKNYMLPEPPKPGEYMRCRICGQIMMPQDFSKDPKIRKQEFKWQHHDNCKQIMFERCDRETPGLMSERKSGLSAGRQLPGRPQSK